MNFGASFDPVLWKIDGPTAHFWYETKEKTRQTRGRPILQYDAPPYYSVEPAKLRRIVQTQLPTDTGGTDDKRWQPLSQGHRIFHQFWDSLPFEVEWDFGIGGLIYPPDDGQLWYEEGLAEFEEWTQAAANGRHPSPYCDCGQCQTGL